MTLLNTKQVAKLLSVHPKHVWEVALSVAAGMADVGLTTHAWAKVARLAFHAVDSESYGLCVRAAWLGDPRVVRACEVVQSDSFRRILHEHHGYGVSRTGELRFS